MKSIKSFLIRLLGQPAYLRLTSSLFFLYYKMGWLKNNPSYNNHHYANRLVKAGDVVIDIGGNLGYFTRIFSKIVGPQGKVLAVEPVALYRKVLERNVAGLNNVTILPYALGESETEIQMGNPSVDKHRHGLMRVLKKEEATQLANTYPVQMKTPMQLFNDLQRVNYVKCDIEGYEIPVIPLMRPLIEKHRPLMQIETDGDNKKQLLKMFEELNYQPFYVDKDTLLPLLNPEQALYGDIIFMPAERKV
jgi:FkbM family methyltransferase